jgi:hypothetical protein
MSFIRSTVSVVLPFAIVLEDRTAVVVRSSAAVGRPAGAKG